MENLAIDNRIFHKRRWLSWLFLGSIALIIAIGALWQSGLYTAWFGQSATLQDNVFQVAMLPQERSPSDHLFQWVDQADAEVATFEAQGVTVGSRLFVFGGFTAEVPIIQATTQSQVLDTLNNTWSLIAPMPEALTHAAIAVNDTTVYFVGGFIGDHPGPTTAHVWKYDTLTDQWSAGPDLPQPRGAGAAGIVDNQLHFFGGTFREGEVYSDTIDHYALDLNDPQALWQPRSPLPVARNHIGGAVLDGLIYAIGGQLAEDESWGNVARVDRYDPQTDTWERIADLPQPRSHVSSSVIPYQDTLIVLGGTVNGAGGGAANSTVSIYDPRRNIWVQLTWLPQALKTPVAGVINHQLFVATGYGSDIVRSTWSADLYDTWMYLENMPIAQDSAVGGIVGNTLYVMGGSSPETLAYRLSSHTWVASDTLQPRPVARSGHTSAVVDDRLLLFGGATEARDLLQIFTPQGNSWITQTMPYEVQDSAAAVISDTVFLVGGVSNGVPIAKTYSYSLDQGWTERAALPEARAGAVVGTDGSRVFVFGGRNSQNQTTTTVFVYDPQTNQWQQLATQVPLPRSDAGQAIWLHNRFYIVSGNSTNWLTPRVDVYDPVTATWTQGHDIPDGLRDMLTDEAGGMIYVLGGNIGSPVNLFELYLPGAEVPAGPTPTPTIVPTAEPTPTLIQQTPTATPIVTNDYSMLLPYVEK